MRNFGNIRILATRVVASVLAVCVVLGSAMAQTGHTTSLHFDKVVPDFGKRVAGRGEEK